MLPSFPAAKYDGYTSDLIERLFQSHVVVEMWAPPNYQYF